MLKMGRHINPEEISVDGSAPSSERVALLLAGGDGTRLQELTRAIAGAPIPKQYCRLLRNSSLLEATVSRARLFAGSDRLHVVVNQDHIALAREQLHTLPDSNIFVQPRNLDTGPGMLFALFGLERRHPNATVAVFPTDHYVDNDRAFVGHLLRAAGMISRMPDKIAVLGVAPDRPETGYGYILPAGPVEVYEKSYHVQTFTEKPSLLSARNIISRGGLWNTFVMVFKVSRMLELLSELVPEEFREMELLRREPEKAQELYKSLSSWNLSNRVLTRIAQHLIMVEVADVSWSDWGTRESVERTYRALNMVPFWNMTPSISSPHY